MSTFDGIVREYPMISIDRFIERNYDASVYFLSHCHRDHMEGLDATNFCEHLKSSPSVRIYVSEVTKHLLVNDDSYSHLSDYLEVICIEHPTTILIPNAAENEQLDVVVTLLPAGHSPGSVMFLIEGANGTVLYTGDFRLAVGDTARFKALHHDTGQVKSIDGLYVDTTFCYPEALYIPSRQECLDAIVSHVEPWILKGDEHIVYFLCPAQYGYESIFIALFEKFGMKTHVTRQKLKKYKGITEIEKAVDDDPNSTKIHSCIYRRCALSRFKVHGLRKAPCGYCTPGEKKVEIMVIKTTAMKFTKHISTSDIIRWDKAENMYRACFSTHSSLTEIRDLVQYLQPKNVYPNVVPPESSESEVMKWLLPVLKYEKETESRYSIPPFGLLKMAMKDSISSSSEGSLTFDYECKTNVSSVNKNKDFVLDKPIVPLLEIKKEPSNYASSSDITNSQDTENKPINSDDEISSNTSCDTHFTLNVVNSLKCVVQNTSTENLTHSNASEALPKWEYPSLSTDDSVNLSSLPSRESQNSSDLSSEKPLCTEFTSDVQLIKVQNEIVSNVVNTRNISSTFHNGKLGKQETENQNISNKTSIVSDSLFLPEQLIDHETFDTKANESRKDYIACDEVDLTKDGCDTFDTKGNESKDDFHKGYISCDEVDLTKDSSNYSLSDSDVTPDITLLVQNEDQPVDVLVIDTELKDTIKTNLFNSVCSDIPTTSSGLTKKHHHSPSQHQEAEIYISAENKMTEKQGVNFVTKSDDEQKVPIHVIQLSSDDSDDNISNRHKMSKDYHLKTVTIPDVIKSIRKKTTYNKISNLQKRRKYSNEISVVYSDDNSMNSDATANNFTSGTLKSTLVHKLPNISAAFSEIRQMPSIPVITLDEC